MIPVKILDETAPLETVVLGTAESLGGVPNLDEAYDPKSVEHIKASTYPLEPDLKMELEQVASILRKYGVEVFRPEVIRDYNQVFARDIAIVIDDQLIVPYIIPQREKESDGIQHVIDQVDQTLLPGETERMEGGDVILWEGHLFVGYSGKEAFEKYKTARTGMAGLCYLKEKFPRRNVVAFELHKSDDDPRENALHLDCCFQPVGKDKAVIYPDGFKYSQDVRYLMDFFGKENIHEITREEMYEMSANFFSISPEVVISDSSFVRLNEQFRKWGLKVEEVKYREAAKMGGLLRCTTMPLKRKYD